MYDKDVYSHSPEAITRHLRGSQRNAIHKKRFIEQSGLPFKPFTRSHTAPNFKKSEQKPVINSEGKGEEGEVQRKQRRGEERRKKARKEGRRESVQHMEGGRSHETGEDG